MRSTCGAFALLCLGGGLALVAAGGASANPMVVPVVENAASGLSRLFLVNLPVDMLLFSVASLMVMWKLKSCFWAAPKGPTVLVAEVAVSAVIIAVAGAVIDFYLLFTEYSGPVFYEHFSVYYPDVTLGNMVLAGVVVFTSVYAVSFAIMRIRLVPSLVPAGFVTAINMSAWTVWGDGSLITNGDAIVLLAGLLFLPVPPLMFGMQKQLMKKGVLS